MKVYQKARDYQFANAETDWGCKGPYSLGCKFCISLTACIKKSGDYRIKHRPYIERAIGIDPKTGEKCWNGEMIPNPFWEEIFEELKNRPTRIILSYSCDVADLSVDRLEEICKILLENPIHEYIFLTKKPHAFDKKMKKVYERFLNRKIDIFKNNNFVFAVSVESNGQKGRIKTLRKSTLFKRKQVWAKPLIGILSGVNYEGIELVRINKEKGNHKHRPTKESWILTIMEEACRCGSQVYLDSTEKDIQIMLKKNLMTIEGLCKIFVYVNNN